MSNINSYYLYKRQRKPSAANVWEDIHPLVLSIDGDGTQPVILKEQNSVACGYNPEVTPIYRYVPDGTYCMDCE